MTMLNQRWALRLATLAALALTAAACGSSSNADDTTTADDTEGSPLAGADEAGDTPAVAGVCAPGHPDCEDTLVVAPDVSDLPSTGDEGPVPGATDAVRSSGTTIDGGLTISEALATDATGILAVKGHFFDDGTGPRLCEGLVGLGERYGCDGQHISVTNLDSDTLGTSVVFHDGLTYTEDLLTLFGELVDGSLIVDNLVAR